MDTRKYPRVFTTFPVECKQGDRTLRGRASTLGGGGLFLEDSKAFPEGSEVSIRFRPARHLPFIQVRARICYVLPGKGSGTRVYPDQPERPRTNSPLDPPQDRESPQVPAHPARHPDLHQGFHDAGLSRDVSSGGMFIETHQPGAIGSEIDLRFHLNDGGPVVIAVAEIKYHVPKLGMGVEFTEMSPADRRRIEAHVASLPVAPERVPDGPSES